MTATPPAGTTTTGLVVRIHGDVGPVPLDVDLTVAPGETVALIGPNGAGKTTLLHAVAGLVALTSTIDPAVVLDGAVLDRRPAHDRAVGLVFQDLRLFPHLDVAGNVAFGPRARGADRRTASAAADAVLERLALTPLADRRTAGLSGGEAQRVALARALAADPALLLLDEPLAALDAVHRPAVREHLGRDATGFTGPTLLVTHDGADVAALADRVAVLDEGRLVAVDTPDALAAEPPTLHAARVLTGHTPPLG